MWELVWVGVWVCMTEGGEGGGGGGGRGGGREGGRNYHARSYSFVARILTECNMESQCVCSFK